MATPWSRCLSYLMATRRRSPRTRQYSALIAGITRLRTSEMLTPLLANFSIICLDTYIPIGVYTKDGIGIRNYCRAEPLGDLEPLGLIAAVRGGDRTSASDVAADC